MRVVLLNPPVPRGSFTNRDLMGGMGIDDGFGLGLGARFVSRLKNEGTRMPVMALGYAAALLHADHDVTVLDLAAHDPDDPATLERVVSLRPDHVVAATSFAFLGSEIGFLSRVHAVTNCRRLLLGYGATHFASEILSRGLAEAVARGDAEIAIGQLARGTLGHTATDGVQTDATVVRDAYVSDLDALPFPHWESFDRGLYGYFPLLKKRPFVTLQSSRGCPYGCHFCPYPIAQGADFRGRSAVNVVDEIEHVVTSFGVRSILFRDPTFSMDTERPRAIAREIIRRGVTVEWGIETRLDRMDEEMIDLLARAGVRSCEFGIDPIDADVRKASHRKGIAPDRARTLIATMESLGIAAAGLCVIGLPEQSRDEVERTLDWIDTLPMSYVSYEVATPFPGTPLYDQAVARGWTKPLTLDDLLAGDPKLAFNGVIDVAEMKRLQDRALQRFYVRPGKIAREVFNRDLFANVKFFARSGWKFVRSEIAS